MERPSKKRNRQSSKKKRPEKALIAYVGTFPPRECGIATFTEDLVNALDELLLPTVGSKIFAMNASSVARYNYPKKVLFQISQDSEQEYAEAAAKINRLKSIAAVSIQHEFGIYGGEYGANLLKFLATVTKPIVVTMHTVLPSPDERMRSVVRSIGEHSQVIVTMTFQSKKILIEEYGLPEDSVVVIPHGIHHRPYVRSKHIKSVLGFSGRTVLSTFGLINKGKGIEYVIEALPEVVKKFPEVLYIIFGMTHPVVLRQEGETYRNFLIQRVFELGLTKHVRFYNQYFSLDKLLQFLEATDVYLSTSLNPAQAVSGTLSYALGAGRPVISTSFAQAKEDVTGDVGTLVEFQSREAYTHAIIDMLGDEERRIQLGKNAYFKTRRMTWSNVAIEYLRLFSRFSPALAKVSEQKGLPRIKLDHLERMTDGFGMVQFAKLAEPDLSSGYTLDDNARALIFVSEYLELLSRRKQAGAGSSQKKVLAELADIYLGFFEQMECPDGYFDNYATGARTKDEQFNLKDDLDDTNGRAVYALAVAACSGSMPKHAREKARQILERSLKQSISLSHLRALSFYVKGLARLCAAEMNFDGIDIRKLLENYCDRLVELYRQNSSEKWQWFEPQLTYSNATLPEALLLGYKATGCQEYFEVGRKTLDFLVQETFSEKIYIPVGQAGWYSKGGEKHIFDQQPEDVAAMVVALKTAYGMTRDRQYRTRMRQSFNWFLGDNVLYQVVYDQITGGCYDGVREQYINLNQGAESTVSYLLARLVFVD